LASAIEYVLSAQLCTVDTLHETAGRLATPGRPWARRFLRVLGSRAPGAPAESEPELRVTNALIQRGVSDLRRQFRVRVPGYGPARFDGAIPELLWAVEVDVHPEHATGEGTANDKVRDRKSRAVGWEIERVSELDLSLRFDETIGDLVASVQNGEIRLRACRCRPLAGAMSNRGAIRAHRSPRRGVPVDPRVGGLEL
jgi:hypothetical protein